MTVQKRYRLWIGPHGKPLYVEVLEGPDLDPGMVEIIRNHLDEMKLADAKTTILSPEWELRVLA